MADSISRPADGRAPGAARRRTVGGLWPAVRALSAVVFLFLMTSCSSADVGAIRETDLTEAAVFVQSNIAAIQRRDTEAYLGHYVDSPELTIASADSIRRGFFLFSEARRASDEWPDTLVTAPATLVWLAPGVVWAGFRFMAVLEGDTTRGVSERVLVKTPSGWKITVTGSMEQ